MLLEFFYIFVVILQKRTISLFYVIRNIIQYSNSNLYQYTIIILKCVDTCHFWQSKKYKYLYQLLYSYHSIGPTKRESSWPWSTKVTMLSKQGRLLFTYKLSPYFILLSIYTVYHYHFSSSIYIVNSQTF
jgi:hypothetical protein